MLTNQSTVAILVNLQQLDVKDEGAVCRDHTSHSPRSVCRQNKFVRDGNLDSVSS